MSQHPRWIPTLVLPCGRQVRPPTEGIGIGMHKLLTAATCGVMLLLLGFAPAASAAPDYPPSVITPTGRTTPPTALRDQVATLPTPGTGVIARPAPVAPASSAPTGSGLPFTGGNDASLFWAALAIIGAGAAIVARFRARSRAS